MPTAYGAEFRQNVIDAARKGEWVSVDVKPGSDTNPVNLCPKGVTPIAPLPSGTLDTTSIAPATLRMGPFGAPVEETTARGEDVNGDGFIDQTVHVRIQKLGLKAGATQLCLTDELSNGRTISSCDSVSS